MVDFQSVPLHFLHIRYYTEHNGWPYGCSFFSPKDTAVRPTIVLMIVHTTYKCSSFINYYVVTLKLPIHLPLVHSQALLHVVPVLDGPSHVPAENLVAETLGQEIGNPEKSVFRFIKLQVS